MGTMWGKDDTYIFDDSVLDMAWKFAPKDKKIAKMVRKIKEGSKHGQWRGLVLMYEAFKNYNWHPNAEMVAIEADHALNTLTDDWKDKEEAAERLRKMRDHMINPHGKKQPSLQVDCPFCVVSEDSVQIQMEFPEGSPPCLVCNGTHQVSREKYVDCPFCEEPYVERYKQIGGMRVKMLPCQVCEGTHGVRIDSIIREIEYQQDDEDIIAQEKEELESRK